MALRSQIDLEFSGVSFEKGGKLENLEKLSEQGKNQQQTQSIFARKYKWVFCTGEETWKRAGGGYRS